MVVADVDNSFRPGLFAASPRWCRPLRSTSTSRAAWRTQARGRLHRFADHPDDARARPAGVRGGLCARRHRGALPEQRRDMVDCADKAGEATGIPDIPIVTTEIAQMLTGVVPDQCPSIDLWNTRPDPADLPGQRGRVLLLPQARERHLHGINVYVNDLKSSAAAAKVSEEAQKRKASKSSRSHVRAGDPGRVHPADPASHRLTRTSSPMPARTRRASRCGVKPSCRGSTSTRSLGLRIEQLRRETDSRGRQRRRGSVRPTTSCRSRRRSTAQPSRRHQEHPKDKITASAPTPGSAQSSSATP